MGPGLGGGHGRYQGYYGLIIDMLISMNVVLANGTAITISEDSYPDLWWAMRGAGHNFGIVTSYEAEIHGRTVDAWYVHHFIFTQDQLEDAFEVFNTHMTTANPPAELLEYAVYYWNPEVSESEVSCPTALYQLWILIALAHHRHVHSIHRLRGRCCSLGCRV